MAEGAGGAGGGGGSVPPAPGAGGPSVGDDWLRLSSFDAGSFFAQQQQQQEQQRAQQGQQLQAVADQLLPSSSDDSSSGGSESEGEGAREAAAAGGAAAGAAGVDGRSGSRRHRSRSRSRSGSRKRKRRDGRRGGSGDSKKKKRRGSRERNEKGRGKEQKRQRESEREQQVRLERQTGAAQRAPQVKAWATGQGGQGEPYYFDTRGDPANLAFGGLYRMDVAQYRRHDPTRYAASLGARRRGTLYGIRQLPTESDGHALKDRLTRYFGPGAQRAERNARMKRWRRSVAQQGVPRGASGADALLGWRRAPAQQAQQGQRGGQTHSMQLPSCNYLPLRPAEDDAGQQAGQAGRQGQAGTQQPPERQGQPLSAAEELAAERQARWQREGETNEEMLIRRTREFNVATRERPHDVHLWLDFARFQDEAVRRGPARRGGERGAAEKKIAILEKALSLHPGSDELLLALLHTAEAVCEDAELERRWRAVLARHSGSPRLWRAYLRHRRTSFAGFSATDVAAAYDDAFAALHREQRRRAAQGAPAAVLCALEAEAVGLALEGCALRLAAGATERGLAALLVLLEFNCMAPEGWPEDALEVMFEEFWRSGAPLLGQPGAMGWGAWMAGAPAGAAQAAAATAGSRREREAAETAAAQQQQHPQQQQHMQQQAEQHQAKPAEWSGWEEMAPAIRARFGHGLRLDSGPEGEGAAAEGEQSAEGAVEGVTGEGGEEEAGTQEEEEEEEAPVEEEEETEEQLMERLGLKLEAALEVASEAQLTPPLLEAWLATERQRQAAQWVPQRAVAAAEGGAEGEEEDEEAAERSSVAWRDVRRLLWRFESDAAKQQLLTGCLLLLGAPLPGALPSNSPAAAAAVSGGDELWHVAAVAGCQPRTSRTSSSSGSGGSSLLADLLSSGDWSWAVGAGGAPADPHTLRQQPWFRADPSRRCMLEQLLTTLVQGPCRQDGAIAAALLAVAGEGSVGQAAAGGKPLQHGRTLAKQLLAAQRSNLALWQAYAQLELAAGSTKAARKVYQTCFATVGAPSGLAAASSAAPLVLAAVQLELQLGCPGSALLASLPAPTDVAPNSSSGGDGAGLLPSLVVAASDAAVAAAARQLAWLGSGGAVVLPSASSTAVPAAAALSPEDIVAAKRGFQDHLLALMKQQQQAQQAQQAQRGLTAGGRALVAAAAAFEQLVGRLRGSLTTGVKAALAIYEQVLAALVPVPPAPHQQQQQPPAGPADAQLELLSWQRCQLAADAAQRALPCAPAAAARDALLHALRLFPCSPALLQLLVAHEMAGHSLTQLRRELHRILELWPSPQAWLSLLAVEVTTRSPAGVVAATLERAVSHPSGRACPLLWRCYLRFEAHRGRHETARRLFLRAIGACPWSKAVWCDGLALLNGRVAPKELSEYLEVMKDKDLVLRTDVFEVALAQLEAGETA